MPPPPSPSRRSPSHVVCTPLRADEFENHAVLLRRRRSRAGINRTHINAATRLTQGIEHNHIHAIYLRLLTAVVLTPTTLLR
jgi:hypothetical protein